MAENKEKENPELSYIFSRIESPKLRGHYSSSMLRKLDHQIVLLDEENYSSLCAISQIVKARYPKLSRKCLNLGNELKDIECSFALAQSLFTSQPFDIRRSYKILRYLATKEKYSHAAFLLANIYNPLSDLNLRAENPFVGNAITNLSMEHALWWHKMAADYLPNTPLYQYTLAEIVFKGEIVKQNVNFARDYYRKIVKLGRESLKSKKQQPKRSSPKKTTSSPTKRRLDQQKKKMKNNMDDLNFIVVCSLLRLSKIFRTENKDSLARKCILESEKFGNTDFKEHLKVLERLLNAEKLKHKKVFQCKYKLDDLLNEVNKIELPSDEIPGVKKSSIEGTFTTEDENTNYSSEEGEEERSEESENDDDDDITHNIVVMGPDEKETRDEEIDILDGFREDGRPNPPPPTPYDDDDSLGGGKMKNGGVSSEVIRGLLLKGKNNKKKKKDDNELLDIRYLVTPENSPESKKKKEDEKDELE